MAVQQNRKTPSKRGMPLPVKPFLPTEQAVSITCVTTLPKMVSIAAAK